ncbi:homoserine O-acetyltransferase [Sesbania bispinosa]|nr:homoserine O-acetyltransferase [Sesbania bispinosa]
MQALDFGYNIQWVRGRSLTLPWHRGLTASIALNRSSHRPPHLPLAREANSKPTVLCEHLEQRTPKCARGKTPCAARASFAVKHQDILRSPSPVVNPKPCELSAANHRFVLHPSLPSGTATNGA